MVERWAALVPELSCRDLEASLHFYCAVLGFRTRFARPGEGFAYLERGGAEIMLEKAGQGWATGPLEPPLGRGINFQIEVEDAAALCARVRAAGYDLFGGLAERWYRETDIEHGQTEFLVQDPDGYLLRFAEPLGTRPISIED